MCDAHIEWLNLYFEVSVVAAMVANAAAVGRRKATTLSVL